MRYILVVFFMVLALPALAQQERECRGKQTFDLGDGSYGCLLEIGTSSITNTLTRDDGASSKSTSSQAGEMVVAMFGAHSSSRQAIGTRMRTICKTFLPQLQQDLAGKRYSRILMQLVWPRVGNTGDFAPVSQVEFDVQFAFTNARCRGIRFFG